MYLSLCDHKFCRDCFSAFCRVSVWNGDFNLKCPAHKCKTTLEPHMVKEALSKVSQMKYIAYHPVPLLLICPRI